ncbi:MAG: type II secretion system F family protein [Chloroflexota bacterium]
MGLSAETLAALCAGFAVVLVAAGLAHRRDTAWIGARLGSYVDGPGMSDLGANRSASRSRAPAPITARFPGWSGLGIDEMTLVQADVVMTIRKFLMFQALSAALSWVAGFLFAIRAGIEGIPLVFVLIFMIAMGVRIPRWVIGFKRARRLSKFEQRFASAIDTISNALEAGMSLPQALESIAREMPPPTGVEFTRVVRELNMGRSLSEALRGLLERVPSVDVDIFVTAIEIQYKIGGNLSNILRTISHTVRERLRIRSEVSVLTAQQRASSWIVTGAPISIALVISLVNPEYMGRLFDPGIGRVLLGYAIISVSIGFYVLQRIADIEV